MKTIVLTQRAARELDAVPRPARRAISNALHAYALTGDGDVKKLSGREGNRMRIGSGRVIFAEDAATILAIYVGRRSSVDQHVFGMTPMLDLKPQFIKTESGDLVVLTRAEYDRLLAQAGNEDEEEEIAVFDARMAELAAGFDGKLPPEVTAFMLAGDGLIKALRRWRAMTQVQMSSKTALAQSYISDIESGRKSGTPEALRRIAQALDIDPKWLG